MLFTGAPFALFQICLAVTTLLDKSVQPAFPRWSAYYNLFASFFMCEASLLLFFKTGPFSQDGVLVFYVPMIVFFVWIVMFSVLTLRAINAEAQRPVSDPPLMDRLRTPPPRQARTAARRSGAPVSMRG